MGQQRIRYLRTGDGIGLAWAEAGQGLPLVKAANWLTHLQYDWESPVWRHWMRFLAGHYRYIRHDERGCGMSDREVGDLSSARWLDDLEQVVEAAAIERPFALLGISQGAATAVAYAVRHPERVSHLILYGGYVVGSYRREDAEAARLYRAVVELLRSGWDHGNPAFRQLFTSRFIPTGDPQQVGWLNELCLKTTRGEIGATLMEARANVDVRELLAQVRVPTLVLHGRRDQVVPFSEGVRLASGIPGAEFVELDSCNHVLLEQEPAWTAFRDAVLAFTGVQAAAAGAPAGLSRRERELLPLLCQGLGNAEIAWRLGISEKTVRNQLTGLYAKLGVHSRAGAIAHAHAHQLIDPS
ncbi:alpha/beta fold hydrolase [Luteimonas viscosa]|uniref:Alpha/beta fold hydrolase n=1 Tax=Luteimonas viscosa TaxID=1132694 RepID=A0A5D4XRC8_9GAMM|nr:alpha/beta fold hydrolase [Luteimonas viscosa]TYT27248.1 alpha/beta fold hydrolase [Luteimonas viscosa]